MSTYAISHSFGLDDPFVFNHCGTEMTRTSSFCGGMATPTSIYTPAVSRHERFASVSTPYSFDSLPYTQATSPYSSVSFELTPPHSAAAAPASGDYVRQSDHFATCGSPESAITNHHHYQHQPPHSPACFTGGGFTLPYTGPITPPRSLSVAAGIRGSPLHELTLSELNDINSRGEAWTPAMSPMVLMASPPASANPLALQLDTSGIITPADVNISSSPMPAICWNGSARSSYSEPGCASVATAPTMFAPGALGESFYPNSPYGAVMGASPLTMLPMPPSPMPLPTEAYPPRVMALSLSSSQKHQHHQSQYQCPPPQHQPQPPHQPTKRRSRRCLTPGARSARSAASAARTVQVARMREECAQRGVDYVEASQNLCWYPNCTKKYKRNEHLVRHIRS